MRDAWEPAEGRPLATGDSVSWLICGPILNNSVTANGRARMVYHWKVKIVMVGDVSVGKTSLVKRYTLDIFDEKYIMTVGAKVTSKEVDFKPRAASDLFKASMVIWDVMGAQGVKELLQEAYFYNANGVLAVCDLTRRETLAGLAGWIQAVQNIAGSIPCILLANKADLKGRTLVSDPELQAFGTQYNLPYLKTSAKTGENIPVAFDWLLRAIYEKGLAKEPGKAVEVPGAS